MLTTCCCSVKSGRSTTDHSHHNYFNVNNNMAEQQQQQLKVYFCGSIRAGRQDVALYGRLVEALQKDLGFKVLTAFVADPAITETGSELEGGDAAIHDRDVQWLEEADGEKKLKYFLEK